MVYVREVVTLFDFVYLCVFGVPQHMHISYLLSCESQGLKASRYASWQALLAAKPAHWRLADRFCFTVLHAKPEPFLC